MHTKHNIYRIVVTVKFKQTVLVQVEEQTGSIDDRTPILWTFHEYKFHKLFNYINNMYNFLHKQQQLRKQPNDTNSIITQVTEMNNTCSAITEVMEHDCSAAYIYKRRRKRGIVNRSRSDSGTRRMIVNQSCQVISASKALDDTLLVVQQLLYNL